MHRRRPSRGPGRRQAARGVRRRIAQSRSSPRVSRQCFPGKRLSEHFQQPGTWQRRHAPAPERMYLQLRVGLRRVLGIPLAMELLYMYRNAYGGLITNQASLAGELSHEREGPLAPPSPGTGATFLNRTGAPRWRTTPCLRPRWPGLGSARRSLPQNSQLPAPSAGRSCRRQRGGCRRSAAGGCAAQTTLNLKRTDERAPRRGVAPRRAEAQRTSVAARSVRLGPRRGARRCTSLIRRHWRSRNQAANRRR